MATIREWIEELKAKNKIQDAMLRYDTEPTKPTKEETIARCDALIRELKDPEKAKRFIDITEKVARSAAVSAEDFARMAEQMRKIKKSINN